MTREAINELKKYTIGRKNTEKVEISVLQIKRVIKALEQEPCEDAISRQAVLNLINADWKYEGLETDVASLPPVNPQPKIGHWIIKGGKEQGYDIGGVKTWYIQIMCSECGFIKTAIEGHTGQYHYCPNCGAKIG